LNNSRQNIKRDGKRKIAANSRKIGFLRKSWHDKQRRNRDDWRRRSRG
jgi:hypothetical protein